MANRALAAKHERAKRQRRELAHVESTKAAYILGPRKGELRALIDGCERPTVVAPMQREKPRRNGAVFDWGRGQLAAEVFARAGVVTLIKARRV